MKKLKKLFLALCSACMIITVIPSTPVKAAPDAVVLKLAGSGTVNIYRDENLTRQITYVQAGGNYGGDMALLDETSNAYKIKMADYVGWVAKSSTFVPVTIHELKSPSYYSVNSSGELFHRISTNPTSTSYSTSLVMGPAPSYLSKGETYYSYDGHYFYSDFEDMIEDYRNDEYDYAINADEPYYNYYQYLPFHSISSYSSADLDHYIENTLNMSSKPSGYPASSHQSVLYDEGSAFVGAQDDYGVNALLMFGIAVNESASGTSQISIKNNNIFGLNAHDSNTSAAKKYESVFECIEKFATYHINWGYLDFNDGRYNGGHVGNKASGMNVMYASDPYWGEKAAMYAYRIDKALGLKDYEAYTIALHDNDSTFSLYKNANTKTAIAKYSGLVSNIPFIVRNEVDGYYEVTTDFHLDDNRSLLKHNDSLWEMPFDFNNNYGYVSTDEAILISNGDKTQGGQPSGEGLMFEDANLKAAINAELNQASDATITARLAREITELKLDATNISSLKGIEALTRLKKLEIVFASNTKSGALGGCSALSEVIVSPKNASQLSFLSDLASLSKVTIKDYTLTSSKDLPSLSGLRSFTLEGGSNKDMRYLDAVSASSIEVLNQKVSVNLKQAGEVMVYENEIRDASGDLLDLSKAVVYAEGSEVVSSYDKGTKMLSVQALPSALIEIMLDMKLSGNVNHYEGVLSSTKTETVNADLSKNGWQKLDTLWVFVENQKLVTGWKEINGTWYAFKDNGVMITGWFKDAFNCWYFMDYSNGAMKKGWAADGSDWYYLNPANGIMQTGWLDIDGATYYLLTSGKTAGSMVTGIQSINGLNYEFDSKGHLLSERPDIPVTPTQPSDPELPSDPDLPINPETPVDPEQPTTPNAPITGDWIFENNQYSFKQSDGAFIKDQWAVINNSWFAFDVNGIMRTGWVAAGKDWYWLSTASGVMQYNYWVHEKDVYYYVGSDAKMVKGQQVIDGKTYLFADNGALIS